MIMMGNTLVYNVTGREYVDMELSEEPQEVSA
jgi:hypothetical protein